MIIKVWSWRAAIQKAKIPSTTKLVLFNLSVYMNELGQSCYPTIKQQMEDTGLSNRAVITHLQAAQEAGFLTITKEKHGNQDWIHNAYIATYPDQNPVNVVHPPQENRVNVVPRPSEPDDRNPVNVVHTNTPLNSPINTPLDFEIFWDLYPRKTGKQAALRQYEKTSKKMTARSLFIYLQAFVDAHNKAGTDKQFVMEASKWLYQERWNDDLSHIRARPVPGIKNIAEPPRRKFNPNDED